MLVGTAPYGKRQQHVKSCAVLYVIGVDRLLRSRRCRDVLALRRLSRGASLSRRFVLLHGTTFTLCESLDENHTCSYVALE